MPGLGTPFTTGWRIMVVSCMAALVILVSTGATVPVRAQEAEGASGAGLHLCLESAPPVNASQAGRDIVAAVTATVDRSPAFFPDIAVTSVPGLDEWDQSQSPNLEIGFWSTAPSNQTTIAADLPGSAGAGCLSGDASWTARISHELVQAAAGRILATARLPVGDADPLVPESAEARIDVQFDPAHERIRTVLDFEVEVAFGLKTGGTCWIDDDLRANSGRVVIDSVAGMDVRLGGEAGCERFRQFMEQGGAGEQAMALLPAEIALADGSLLRFVARSVEIDGTDIVVAGSIEQDRP